MEIKGSIDPNHCQIVQAMRDRDDVLLPKTMAAAKEKPLVVMEVRRVMHFGCR